MANRIKKTAPNKTDRILKLVVIVLALLGAADSIYLLVLKYTQAEAMCIGVHSCITVNNSIYSEIYGIPVSAFGILAYLVMAGIGLLETRVKLAGEYGPLAVFGTSLAGVAFSAYLTYIEFFVLNAVCPFCLASAIIITAIFIVAIIRVIRQFVSQEE